MKRMHFISSGKTSRSAALGVALTAGALTLTGCHEVRQFNPLGTAAYNEHKEEQVLIEKMKANPQDYESLMRLAEIRAASGRERAARYNYSQIIAADTTNNPQLELMQSQAEVHYAILKATYDSEQAIADTGFQFNLRKAEDVLKGQGN